MTMTRRRLWLKIKICEERGQKKGNEMSAIVDCERNRGREMRRTRQGKAEDEANAMI